jgi:hypothetical protein
MNALAVSHLCARMVFKIVDRNGDVNKIGENIMAGASFFLPTPAYMILSLTI